MMGHIGISFYLLESLKSSQDIYFFLFCPVFPQSFSTFQVILFKQISGQNIIKQV